MTPGKLDGACVRLALYISSMSSASTSNADCVEAFEQAWRRVEDVVGARGEAKKDQVIALVSATRPPKRSSQVLIHA